MAEFASEVIPFSSSEGCGDFALSRQTDVGLLVVVGDVAGHGDPVVGELANRIMEYISQSEFHSLSALLQGMRQVPGVSERGVSIFLGLFDIHLPLLHYYLLGDVRAYLTQRNRLKRLANQEGPLGIAPPELNHFHSIKAHPLDLLIVYSDGIQADTLPKLIDTKAHLNPPELVREIISSGRSEDDDAVCAVVRFKGGGSYRSESASPNLKDRVAHNKRAATAVIPETQANSETSEASEVHETPLSPAVPIKFVEIRPATGADFKLLTEDQLLANVRDVSQARLLSSLLWEVVECDSYTRARIESYLLEAIERGSHSVELFADNLRLQLQLKPDKHLIELAMRLFGTESVRLVDDRAVVSIHVATDLDRSTRLRLSRFMSQQSYLDYSDQHRREGLLAQQAKLAAMGEMIGAIAHQWRQPLNELGLRIQQLQLHQHNHGVDTAEIDQYAADSLTLIAHMASTIDDFRDFFSTHQDGEEFDVAQVIREVLRLQAAQLNNNNIVVTLDGQSFSIPGHASYLKQVLFNLISNSKDAFKERRISAPKIHLQLNPIDHSLSLKDNAGGVEPATLERIYEPYYTQKEHGKGTGLGLYMSRMLMLDHFHGSITSTNTDASEEAGLITRMKFGESGGPSR